LEHEVEPHPSSEVVVSFQENTLLPERTHTELIISKVLCLFQHQTQASTCEISLPKVQGDVQN